MKIRTNQKHINDSTYIHKDNIFFVYLSVTASSFMERQESHESLSARRGCHAVAILIKSGHTDLFIQIVCIYACD
jgi:hypothetical protein